MMPRGTAAMGFSTKPGSAFRFARRRVAVDVLVQKKQRTKLEVCDEHADVHGSDRGAAQPATT